MAGLAGVTCRRPWRPSQTAARSSRWGPTSAAACVRSPRWSVSRHATSPWSASTIAKAVGVRAPRTRTPMPPPSPTVAEPRRAVAPQRHRVWFRRPGAPLGQPVAGGCGPLRRRLVGLGAPRRPPRIRQRARRHRRLAAEGGAGRLVVRGRLRRAVVAGSGCGGRRSAARRTGVLYPTVALGEAALITRPAGLAPTPHRGRLRSPPHGRCDHARRARPR